MTIWDFLKKRGEPEQTAEQQRKIETVLAMQTEILALYEPPAGLADELAAVRASFD
jgi:ABC-type branched-subunit amino acid transport system ATPase component